MTQNKYSHFLSKILAILLLALCLLLFWMLFLAPGISDISVKSDILGSMTQQVVRYRAVLLQKETLAEMEVVTRDDPIEDWILSDEGTTDLQGIVRKKAAETGVIITSSRALEEVDQDVFMQVAIQIVLSGRHEEIYAFFNALRDMKPVIFLKDITIRGQGFSPDNPVILSVQMQVFGYQNHNEITS